MIDSDVDPSAAKDVLGRGKVPLEAAVQLSGAQLVVRGGDLELDGGGPRGRYGFRDALFEQPQPHGGGGAGIDGIQCERFPTIYCLISNPSCCKFHFVNNTFCFCSEAAVSV